MHPFSENHNNTTAVKKNKRVLSKSQKLFPLHFYSLLPVKNCDHCDQHLWFNPSVIFTLLVSMHAAILKHTSSHRLSMFPDCGGIWINEHNLGAAVFIRLIPVDSLRQTNSRTLTCLLRLQYLLHFPAFISLQIPQIRPMKWTLI